MRQRLAVLVGVLVTIGAASAAAQPSGEATAPYPSSLVDRPIALPSGLFEVTGQLMTFDYADDDFGSWGDFIISQLRMRAGLGSVELFGEADLMLDHPEGYDYDTLNRVGGGALIPAGRGGGAGFVHAELLNPSSDYKQLGLRGGYGIRRKTASDVALEAWGGVYFTKSMPPEGQDSLTAFSATARLLGQIQLQPTLGAEFGFGLNLPIADDYGDTGYDPDLTSELSARLIFTAARFDAYVGLGLATAYYTQRQVFAGVTGRLP